MMTEEEFKLLILRSEGETIDFKREQYDLINATEDSKAKFVKDVVSFVNTIREESAYIIIGIELTENGKIFHGLNKNIDDSIFQDQLKTRVYPFPNFNYTNITLDGLVYGVIEIPLKNYPEPIAPVVKMRGLDPGKIYMRKGSSNSEAIGKEVIQIDKWIKNIKLGHEVKKEIDELLKQINLGANKLSYYISSALEITNQVQDDTLIRFCKGELVGWYQENIVLNESNLPKHRMTRAMVSIHQIKSIANYGGGHVSIRNELQQNEDFKEIDFPVQESVTEIEAILDRDLGSLETT